MSSIHPTTGVIVVVDDEEEVRGVMVRLLESVGHTVLVATNGEHALQVMQEHHEPVDLVISDINMPEMDGLELVGFLRAAYPNLRALLVSGQGSGYLVENRDRIPEGTHFLAKPFGMAALRQRVQDILES
jgi:two-component system, cell cycle sensor histidine kinase and response regulator CckA